MKLTCRSFAKINLHLQVLGRREDGYHELSTLFQSVALSDEIRFETGGEGIRLAVPGGGAPEGETNLVHRAATMYLQRWVPEAGLGIALEKRIPQGGGLGGGSSNAATTLMALQALFDHPARMAEVVGLAGELGADVPYFLQGGCALGRGRGDDVTALPDLAEREVLLAIPGVEISTASVFDRLRAGAVGSIPEALPDDWINRPDWSAVGKCWNDLEPVVLRSYPEVVDVYNVLVEAGASVVRLSGSGATLFAIFSDSVDCSKLPARLPSDTRAVWTRTLGRSSLDRLRVVQGGGH